MGFITKAVARVAANVIEDAADNLVTTAILGAAAGAVKGVEAVGKAAGSTIKSAVEAKTQIDGIVGTTRDTIDKAVSATIGDRDTRHYRREQQYLSSIAHCPGVIIQKVEENDILFRIYDTEENLLYIVIGRLSKKDVWLTVTDESGKLVGAVYKTEASARAPVFHESSPTDYVVEIMGEQVARIKSQLTKSREKSYTFEPDLWQYQETGRGREITICNEDGTLAHLSKRKGYDVPTYILHFEQRDSELVCLLMMLAFISREYE